MEKKTEHDMKTGIICGYIRGLGCRAYPTPDHSRTLIPEL